ncbi:MAG: thioredoxin family protein [Bacteroidales bacterium]|nr:thioredoxin family protein [Bacteroidales bacterium]
MKYPHIVTLAALLCMAAVAAGQQESTAQKKLYSDTANAMRQIDRAVATASQTGKMVLCQVGGNWCPWCLRFADFVATDTAVHNLVEREFVYIHVNYSRENKNPEAMQRLGNPARFGFPVLVILDGNGNVAHIQNSAYLEEGKGYNEKKVVDCLSHWTRKAITTLK